VARLRARIGAPRSWVTIGVGDDAAVVVPERGTSIALTTDSLVEGVHFRREWTPAQAIGHKALATSLSDLAAMGARPRASLLSLAMPADWPVHEFDALLDGFVALADRAGAPLVGGNLTRSPGPLVVDTTAVGSVHPRRILTRAGGRAGDALFVTGTLGGAAAGLAMRMRGANPAAFGPEVTDCLSRYEQPEPRLRCGLAVARSRAATAAMDLSDGLADAARQVAEASRTGVIIEAEAIPVHPGAAEFAAAEGLDPVSWALSGGEDYELLFAVPARFASRFRGAVRRCQGLQMTRIGHLGAEPGAWLQHADGTRESLPEGFAHFST
jgi:thiamine-monophosphate kinase